MNIEQGFKDSIDIDILSKAINSSFYSVQNNK